MCQKIRDIKDIPNVETAHDYLKIFTLENVKEFLEENEEFLSQVQKRVSTEEITLTSNTHITTAYEHQKSRNIQVSSQSLYFGR